MQAPVALLTPPDRYERQCYCLGLGRVFRARHLGLDNVTVHVTLKLITKLAAGGTLLRLDAILPGGSRLRILPRGGLLRSYCGQPRNSRDGVQTLARLTVSSSTVVATTCQTEWRALNSGQGRPRLAD